MTQLFSIIYKELLLLSRDIHGLLLLFVMPVVFILIMSLAMQDDFSSRAGGGVSVLLNNLSNTPLSERLTQHIEKSSIFSLLVLDGEPDSILKELINRDQYKFLLTIDKDFSGQNLPQTSLNGDKPSVIINISPSASRQMEMIFQGVVREAMTRLRLEHMLTQLQQVVPDIDREQIQSQLIDTDALSVIYSADNNDQPQTVPPTSVQQSVPAWLVFSLFFVVVPLSNTLINERRLGTLKRLRTMNVNPLAIVFGKLIPYFCINQVQIVLMLLVGVYLVPVFGGDSLTLGNSFLGLLFIAIAISCAALGYAMLIAVIARTSEQATTLGGTGNIILAAVGGIMVPTFIMPVFMQNLSQLSPMSWGLQGFLDILLRGGAVDDIIAEVAMLLLFGLGCLALAVLLFDRKESRG